MNLADYQTSLAADPSAVSVSQPFPADNTDTDRTAKGLALRRRIMVYRTLNDGSIAEQPVDVGVLDMGQASEQVVLVGMGVGKDTPNPTVAWLNQVESWLSANATNPANGGDASIVEWVVTQVDEPKQTARVAVVLNSGGLPAGPFTSATWFAAKSGANVLFGPIT